MAHAAPETTADGVEHIHSLLDGHHPFNPLEDTLHYHALKADLGERQPDPSDLSYQSFHTVGDADVAIARNSREDETWIEHAYGDGVYDGVLIDTGGEEVSVRAIHTEGSTIEDPDAERAEELFNGLYGGVPDDTYDDVRTETGTAEVVVDEDVGHGVQA